MNTQTPSASCVPMFAARARKNVVGIIWNIAGNAQRRAASVQRSALAWQQRNVNFKFCLVNKRYPVTFALHIAK